MTTRQETADATRAALVHAAADLLDEGGRDAVTMRAVGSKAGVSRGAPYGHFASKDALLTRLAVDAWLRLTDEVNLLESHTDWSPYVRLERAVLSLIAVGRRQPHLYALMFSTPADDPEAAAAASELEHQFLDLVAAVVGQDLARPYGALVLATAHGLAGMELGDTVGQEEHPSQEEGASQQKWRAGSDELVRLLVAAISASSSDASADALKRPPSTPAPISPDPVGL